MSCCGKRGRRNASPGRTSHSNFVCCSQSRHVQLADRLPYPVAPGPGGIPTPRSVSEPVSQVGDIRHGPPGLQVQHKTKLDCLQMQRSSDGSSEWFSDSMGSVQPDLCLFPFTTPAFFLLHRLKMEVIPGIVIAPKWPNQMRYSHLIKLTCCGQKKINLRKYSEINYNLFPIRPGSTFGPEHHQGLNPGSYNLISKTKRPLDFNPLINTSLIQTLLYNLLWQYGILIWICWHFKDHILHLLEIVSFSLSLTCVWSGDLILQG